MTSVYIISGTCNVMYVSDPWNLSTGPGQEGDHGRRLLLSGGVPGLF